MKKNNPSYLWPAWFFSSLDKKDQSKIKVSILNKLAKGQTYLWDALNIYDDILDGSTNAKKLPLANKYFRYYLEIYYRLKLPNDFYSHFNFLLDDLELANQEEFNQKKVKIKDGLVKNPLKTPTFNNLEALSRKSLALSSGSLAILYLINNHKSLSKIPGLINFFKYALAAKQLSDDSKDWIEDLKSGSITYPGSLVLKLAKKNKIELDFKKRPEIIYLLFTKIAPKISQKIEFLCRMARQEAKSINIARNNQLITKIIKPLEMAVLKAQKFNRLLTKSSF
ncbi:MAG: class 1 isoprenoid biosynthesis enzyme [Patescibacteria group bacterium]